MRFGEECEVVGDEMLELDDVLILKMKFCKMDNAQNTKKSKDKL